MVKYVFCCSASILGVKKLSPTQTQVVGYINILSDLQLAFGMDHQICFSQNHVKIRQLVIAMVKYIF